MLLLKISVGSKHFSLLKQILASLNHPKDKSQTASIRGAARTQFRGIRATYFKCYF